MKPKLKLFLSKIYLLEGVIIQIKSLTIEQPPEMEMQIGIRYFDMHLRHEVIIDPMNIELFVEHFQLNFPDIALENEYFHAISFVIKLNIIERAIKTYYGIDPKSVYVKTRKREIIFYRQLIQHFCYIYKTNESLAFIGQQTGNVDHATILNSNRRINDYRDTDKNFRITYNVINQMIITELNQVILSHEYRSF